jgi:peptide/nickel transport system ATP-binding protein
MKRDLQEGALIQIFDMQTYFPIRKGILKRVVGHVKAVDGVDLVIPQKQTVALVGESGCGKTTLGKSLIRLIEPTGGQAFYNGQDLMALREGKLRPLRKDIQIIFQDPNGSLNPRMTVGEIITEGMKVFKIGGNARERLEKAKELLVTVGMYPEDVKRYPHEFSGGQKQRICIARVLAVEPKFVVCDEAVSALDVSIQAQILNLLKKLQKKFDLTYLFITHDLGVVEYIADTVLVMYLGQIVEEAPCEELFKNPKHPYTQVLMSSIPRVDLDAQHDRVILEGDVPSPINPPSGCRFHTRCPYAMDKCKVEIPPLKSLSDKHKYRCFLD